MAKMNIRKRDRPQVKAECLRLLVSFDLNPAKIQLLSSFIDTYLDLNSAEEELFQSQLNKMELERQEKIMQITTSWERKGLEKGKQQGKQQGQSETILRLLDRKLGSVPPEIESSIRSLDSSSLDTLTENLLDFQSLDDLTKCLNSL